MESSVAIYSSSQPSAQICACFINLNIVSILDWWMGGNNVMGGMWIVRTYPIIYVQAWENQR